MAVQHFAGNTYFLCLFVDGVPAPNCTSNVGSMPSDDTFAQGSTSEIVLGVAPWQPHGSDEDRIGGWRIYRIRQLQLPGLKAVS